jgi:hypothetical protein
MTLWIAVLAVALSGLSGCRVANQYQRAGVRGRPNAAPPLHFSFDAFGRDRAARPAPRVTGATS